MIILQKPESLLFEKNIPDIVLQKENTEVSVDFTLKIGTTVILEENYLFDADGLITIRRIDEIVSAYLVATKTVVGDTVLTTGLVQSFDVVLDFTTFTELHHTGVNGDGELIIHEDQGILAARVDIGDKLYRIGTTAPNLLITDIDFFMATITFDGDVEPFVSSGSIAYFESYRSETFSFDVMKCDAEMPDALVATDFVADNFLTRLGTEKRTYMNDSEYLSILQENAYGPVTVNCTVYYPGTTLELFESFALEVLTEAVADALRTFNVSPAKVIAAAIVANSALAGVDIYRYTISCAGTTFQTVDFAYLIDKNHIRNKQCFVFENIFGLLETFTTTGQYETKKNVEITLANIQSRYRKTTQDFTAEKTINTGFLSGSEMEWIDDLLLSYNVATYEPGVSGADEEITLTGSDKTDTNTNVLQAFSFSYRRAKNNHLQFTAAAQGIFDLTFDETFD